MSKDYRDFENDLCQCLGKHGFWAHVFARSNSGSQPCDIIAVNHKGKHLIDAKVCSRKRFVFERMEDNQIAAIEWFSKTCGGEGWFALHYGEDEIYILNYRYIQKLMEEGAMSIGKVPEEFRLENWLHGNIDRE